MYLVSSGGLVPPCFLSYWQVAPQAPLATFPRVTDFSRYSENYYSGTPGVWELAMEKVRLSGKPRTLILDHGEEALALRINLIRSARKSVRIQTFAWAFDEVGKTVMWELGVLGLP